MLLLLCLELQTKVSVDFTITEKVPIRASSWLKVPSSSFTFKTLLTHYAKQTLTQGKQTCNCDPGAQRKVHKGQVNLA